MAKKHKVKSVAITVEGESYLIDVPPVDPAAWGVMQFNKKGELVEPTQGPDQVRKLFEPWPYAVFVLRRRYTHGTGSGWEGNHLWINAVRMRDSARGELVLFKDERDQIEYKLTLDES